MTVTMDSIVYLLMAGLISVWIFLVITWGRR
jgi:hypothetical protein